MSIPWGSTAWAFAPPNMLRSIWMLKFSGMDYRYTLRFEKGENVGGLHKEPTPQKKTGTRIRWKPDLDVFTDIDVPVDYYQRIF